MNAPISIVIGTKGGTGATTICVDAAMALARNSSVAVVDADFAARRSVAVLTDMVRPLDVSRTSANMAIASKNKFTVVEMAASIDGAFTIAQKDVETVALNLIETCDAIVIDAPQPFAAAIRPFVVRAARFVLVVEPTLLGLTNARLVQIELERFGVPRTHEVMVLNGRVLRRDVSRSDIEEALGLKAIVELPIHGDKKYDRAIESLAAALLVNRPGESLLELKPSSSAPIGDRRGSRRRPEENSSNGESKNGTTQAAANVPSPQTRQRDKRDQLKSEINDELTKRLDFNDPTRAVDDAGKLAELRTQVGEVVSEIMGNRTDVGSAEDIAELRQEIIDEALGLGPLEDLLRDPSITEIMVNGPNRIFVERSGKITKTAKRFTNERQLRLIIERIIAPIGRRIDESQPMVDARLSDGSRVNAIINPLSLDGATLTIRRFPERRMQASDLIKIGAVTPELVDFLRAAVEARLNIVVAGGTGSGKTTFLNVLSSFLPPSERIVTIEDAAELSLAQEHVVRLESRPANIQGAGEIRIRDLLRNSLRMRPDRIIVGECRGGEALDMLQAMNTGHDGSLTTIHANSARDAISRIETMVLMAGFDLPVRAIREQIAGAVDMILQLSRMRDGSRKLVSISEVVGLEGDVVTMQDISRYDQQGLDKDGKVAGSFVFTGVQPMCLKKFQEYGISFDVTSLSKMKLKAASW
ncbi:MAG: ATPase, T2SS/T4P/T4SS family [Candidatus Velthaea sp.]|jgi:pilus assembly protein CpaF